MQFYSMNMAANLEPEGGYRVNWKPYHTQEELLDKCRRGDPKAEKELLQSQGGKVWTHEELKALNFYLKHPIPTGPKEPLASNVYLKKDFLSQPELVKLQWVQELAKGEYLLIGVEFPNGTPAVWIGTSVTHLICNLTPYLKREEALFEKQQLQALRRRRPHTKN